MAVNMKKMKRGRGKGKGIPRKEFTPDDIIGYEGYPDPEVDDVAYEGIVHVTPKGGALLVIGGEKQWVPVSQIVDATEDVLTITQWWLDNGDLDY